MKEKMQSELLAVRSLISDISFNVSGHRCAIEIFYAGKSISLKISGETFLQSLRQREQELVGLIRPEKAVLGQLNSLIRSLT